MNELSLFTGTGGGLLGTRLLGWTPICAVEKEPYCREVLLRRQRDGLLPLFPIWDDIKSFSGFPWRGKVDIITAGFPCQPFSVAGRRAGKDDERNMWPDTARVISEVGSRYLFLENVPGLSNPERFALYREIEEGRRYNWEEWQEIRSLIEIQIRLPSYFGRILGDLAKAGYDAEWGVLGADDVGAPHCRKRFWIAAHAISK